MFQTLARTNERLMCFAFIDQITGTPPPKNKSLKANVLCVCSKVTSAFRDFVLRQPYYILRLLRTIKYVYSLQLEDLKLSSAQYGLFCMCVATNITDPFCR